MIFRDFEDPGGILQRHQQNVSHKKNYFKKKTLCTCSMSVIIIENRQQHKITNLPVEIYFVVLKISAKLLLLQNFDEVSVSAKR